MLTIALVVMASSENIASTPFSGERERGVDAAQHNESRLVNITKLGARTKFLFTHKLQPHKIKFIVRTPPQFLQVLEIQKVINTKLRKKINETV